MSGRRRSQPAAAVVTVLAAALAAASARADERDAPPPLAALLEQTTKALAHPHAKEPLRALRTTLGTRVVREPLSDMEWLDLHVALAALDRTLDARPDAGLGSGVVDPTESSADAFDASCVAEKRHPVGYARFAWLLRRTEGLDLGPLAVLAEGERARHATQDALAAFARSRGVDDWRDLLTRAREDHPRSHDELLAWCREAVATCTATVARAEVVSLPRGAESLPVAVFPPEFLHPYAHYIPGKRDAQGVYHGTYRVAPLPRGLDEDARDAWLTEFDRGFVWAVSAHEGVPGHHLQFTAAAYSAGRLRGFSWNSTYVEGWGFYAEDLAAEIGALEGDAAEFALLRGRAWRAVRCYVDPALHVGRIRPSEAVELLMREMGATRRAAELEVRRYLESPTQPMSYWIGRREILAMRADHVARHGPGSLRAFHDALLGLGCVPLPLAAAALLERRAEYDREHP